MAHTRNGVVLHHAKEGNSAKSRYIDGSRGHYAKLNESVTKRRTLCNSTGEVLRTVKKHKDKVKRWFLGLGGQEGKAEGELLNGVRSFGFTR